MDAKDPKQPSDARDAPSGALPWVGSALHYHWLRGIVATGLILNAIDAVMTVVWVSTGLAMEANPVLGSLVSDHPVLFVAAKQTLVSLGSWLLWRRRREPLAVIGIFLFFLVYWWLLLVHLRAFRIAVLDQLLVDSGLL